jgi:hypothetical protein
MTGTNCDLFTHKSSRSYLNHLVQYEAFVYFRHRTVTVPYTAEHTQCMTAFRFEPSTRRLDESETSQCVSYRRAGRAVGGGVAG